MTLTEQADAYMSEKPAADMPTNVRILLRRAYMAGALEALRHPQKDVLVQCLDFARAIGTPAEAA